ncbi:MAG: alpha/beta fold hydrolase [Peptococcaceae bacterium]|nr:alpha/beta fold hydrolase [Peptococcaceae bacterium]
MLHELSFESFNGRDQVSAWIYVPAAKPLGIVQLVHGFGEHSRRYLHMIVRYLEAGFIVAADDHVGHGKTAINNDSWGDWGDAGYTTMVEDERRLQEIVMDKYPDLPYFFFGHSMGSVITRQFIARYGDSLAGATLCGTCGHFPTAEARAQLEALIADGKGNDSDPSASVKLMGWMGERCGDVKIGNEWICADPYVQVDHANDPFDAFTKPITNKSLLYFLDMIDEVTGKEWAEKVPTSLPIYSIGGDQDPFGLYGQGLYETSNWLVDSGHDVKTQLYSGYRHEIHNYADIKNTVCDGVIDFMTKAVK